MKEDKNIEKLFKKEFSGYEEQPSGKVWKGLRSKLMWENFLHFRWNSFNVYYAAGLLLAVTSFWLLISQDPLTPEAINDNENRAGNDPVIQSDTTGYENQDEERDISSADSRERPARKSQAQKKDQSSKDSFAITEEDGPVITTEVIDSLPEDKPMIQETHDSLNHDELPAEPEEQLPDTMKSSFINNLKAYFIPSAFEGCVPLRISFESNSPGANRFEWSFGDGGTSDVEDPVYIFDEPGDYFVSLTVTNDQNQVSTYSEIITAFPRPDAIFEMEVEEIQGAGRTVYFYNYSRGAESYEWDFDDGTFSGLEEPTRIFEEGIDRNIKLVAISPEGCKDSMTLENAFTVDEPELIFPNAFTPNPDGPTGGYYSNGVGNNDVFHPYMPEKPVQYTLRIFNKTGNLIFESKDPDIGWDGYYQQELQPQGVYIYKVKARFRDGQQLVKMGDVTLFHETRW
jgi:gliding motility-associated-like protein